MEDIDTNWINDFEKEEEKYKEFYLEDLSEITLNLIYINKNKEIEKIDEKSVNLSKENMISKEQLIKIIKQNEIYETKKFALSTILLYNIDLEYFQIKSFIEDPKNYDYLKKINHIDDIKLNKSSYFFESLNSLIIIFYEREKNEKLTKKVRFSLQKKKTKSKKK